MISSSIHVVANDSISFLLWQNMHHVYIYHILWVPPQWMILGCFHFLAIGGIALAWTWCLGVVLTDWFHFLWICSSITQSYGSSVFKFFILFPTMTVFLIYFPTKSMQGFPLFLISPDFIFCFHNSHSYWSKATIPCGITLISRMNFLLYCY
jgi:hypothetical protein